MRVTICFICITVLALLIPLLAFSSEYSGYASEFLRVEVGAAPSAMGGAYTSLAEGSIATYWNPAGITSTEHISATFSHHECLMDLKQEFAGFTFKTPIGVFGTSFNTFTYGTLIGYDEQGNKTPDFTARSNCFSVCYARRFIEPVDMGLSFKYIWERIETAKANTIAFDIGVRAKMFNSFLIGMVIQNLGPGEKFISSSNSLPLILRLGSAFTPYESDLFTETASVDFSMVKSGRRCLHLGSQTTLYRTIHLRAGYRHASVDTAEEFTMGAGLSFNRLIPAFSDTNIELDFSQTFGSVEGLGNLSRITMSFEF